MSAQDTAPTSPPHIQPTSDGHATDKDIAGSANAPTADTAGAIIADNSPASTSRWPALRHRDYRLLWAGNFVSQTGSQMRIVAVSVQIWDLTHDYAAVGLLGLFRLLPLLVLALFGGVIADALDRRKLLMVTQSILAGSSAIMAVATQFGWISPAVIYLTSALAACALAFDNPARSALIPNLVPRHHLANALSLNIIVFEVATIFGPMLSGLFLPLHALGFAIIYWIDTISFTAVLIALWAIRTRPQEGATRDVSIKAALDGLHFLRRTPIIMSTMTLDFFATLFGAASLLLPAFAEQNLHLDRQWWGFLYSAPAVGALLAGLVMSWLGNVRRQGWLVLVSVSLYGLAWTVFGVSNLVWLALLALAGTGAADTVSMVMRQTIRQLSTPDELRGRMTSVNMIFYMGGPQLGELEAGLAAQVIGLGPSIALGGLAVVAVAALVGYFVPSLREYDQAK